MYAAKILPGLLVPLCLAGPACTLEPGGWFGSLSASLTAAYGLRPDRDAGDGWQRLSNDYQVKVTAARLELGDIRLLAAGEGSAMARFDPARPPAGYSLCHNGHCHRADGRLVPYAEIEAELAGGQGAAGLTAAVTLIPPETLDLLVPSDEALPCTPDCNLDRGRILRAAAPVTVLSIEGAVRDGRQPPRLVETPFRWQLAGGGDAAAAPPTLEGELDLPLDRRHPPVVDLGLRVELGAAIFDGVDFAALAQAEDRLRANLAEGHFLTATIARRDP
jgi:hypothetical protein